MKIAIPSLFLILLTALPLTVFAAEPEVIYWNSDAGKALRARIKRGGFELIPYVLRHEGKPEKQSDAAPVC
jgi:hypothetical protein